MEQKSNPTCDLISVAICFKNPPDSVYKVIDSTRRLIDSDICNQVILADNNSQRSESLKISEYAERALRGAPSKLILTRLLIEKPGVAHARHAAIMATVNKFLLFLDDDTALIDFNLQRLKVYAQLKSLGSVSTIGIPLSVNGLLPYWFSEYENYYACGAPFPRNYLWTAGLMINARLLQKIYGTGIDHVFLGRGSKGKENSLRSYEDYEYYIWFLALGFGMTLDTSISYHHYIPSEKLLDSYRLELCSSIQEAHSLARFYKLTAVFTCHILLPLFSLIGLKRMPMLLRSFFKKIPKTSFSLILSNSMSLAMLRQSNALDDL